MTNTLPFCPAYFSPTRPWLRTLGLALSLVAIAPATAATFPIAVARSVAGTVAHRSPRVLTDAAAVYAVAPAQNVDSYANGQSLATVSDPDGAITAAALANGTSLPPGVGLNATTGELVVDNATVLVAGAYTFDVSTTDVTAEVTTQSLVLTFSPDTEAAYPASNAFNGDALSNGLTLASVTDADGVIGSAAITTGTLPAGMSFNPATGQFAVSNAAALLPGAYSFSVNTVDAVGGQSTVPVSITVFGDTEAAYSLAPAQNQDSYTNGQNLASVTDANGPLAAAAILSGTLPAWMAFSSATGQFTVASAAGVQPGSYAFTVRTVDATGGITIHNISISVSGDTEAVYSSPNNYNQNALTNGLALASVTDADGAIGSATIATGTVPAGMSFNPATGQFAVIDAAALLPGTYSFSVNTVDAAGGQSTVSVSIRVNANPVAVDITNAPALANTSVATPIGTLGASDADGTIASFTITALPAPAAGILYLRSGSNLTLVTAGQVLTVAQAAQLSFDPVVGFSGNGTFGYVATDNLGALSPPATFTIPVGTAPVAVSDVAGTTPATAVSVNVTTNDLLTLNAATVDLDPAAGGQQAARTVTGGTFTLGGGGQVTFTPNAGFLGTATVPYTVSSPLGVVSNQATIAVTVALPAVDLSMAITAPANNSSVAAGDPLSFTVVAANSGTTTAADVVTTLQLPAGLTGVSFSTGGAYNSTTGEVTFPTLATLGVGSNATFAVTFTAPANGQFQAVATLTAANADANLTNNTATALVNVVTAYDLVTTLTGPAAVPVGTTATFTLNIVNNGPSAATGEVPTIELPAGLTDVFVSNGGTYDATTGVVTYPRVASILAGQSINRTVSFTAPAAGFTATAAIAPSTGDINPADNTDTALPTIITPAPTASANLNTLITASALQPAAGQTVTLAVTVSNHGPDPATSVVGAVSLPAGLAGVVVSGGGSYDPATGLVTFPLVPALVSGASQAQTIQFAAPQTGIVLASASVSATTADPVPANNGSVVYVTVQNTTDLAATLTGPSSVEAGQMTTYALSTYNSGPGVAADVVQTLQLPANLAGVLVSNGGTYDPATGVVTWVTPSLGASVTVTQTVDFAAPEFGPITAAALIVSGTADADPARNSASVITTVTRASDVRVTIAGPAAVVYNAPATYAITTANLGPSAAAAVITTVQLPTGLSGVIASGGGSYDPLTGIVTFPIRTNLAVGAAGSGTNYITFNAPDATYVNLTAVASPTGGTNDRALANNLAGVQTEVTAPTTGVSDVSAVLAASSLSVTAGQAVTFTLTSSNASPTPAPNVQPRLALPIGLSGVVVSNGGTYDAATGFVTWPVIGTLNQGSPVAYTVAVNAPATGPLTALANVTSGNSDGNPANNIAGRNVTVANSADLALSLSGPNEVQAGEQVSYAATVRNNGPSNVASADVTMQIPDGLLGVVVSNGGSYDFFSGLVTWPGASLLSGQTQTRTVSFTSPSPGYIVEAGLTSATADPNPANNTAPVITTEPVNLSPVAANVVNLLQTPLGNTSTQALPLSALNAVDPDGTIAAFTITVLPDATAGVLSLNGTPVTAGQVLTPAEAAQLRFDPATGFVGNVFFNYTATDNQGGVAAPARYSLAVGRDNATVFTNGPVLGNTTPYPNGYVVSAAFDANGGAYSPGLIVTDTGVRSAALAAGSTLPAGVSLDPTTGALTVSNAAVLIPGDYSATITTVDAFGGVTTQPVAFTIGGPLLPVELVRFAMQAQPHAALLTWATASEKNSAYFAVERSADGRTFIEIGRRDAAGNAGTRREYAWTDARPLAGVGYYRLRQVDRDDHTTYSQIRSLTFAETAAGAATVWPNPTTADATVDLTAVAPGAYVVAVFDLNGRRVLAEQPLEAGLTHTLPVAALPPGTYLVRLIGADGQTQTLRLVRQ